MVRNYEFVGNTAIKFEKWILERSRENLEITLQDLKSLVEIGRILLTIEKKRLQNNFNSRKTGYNAASSHWNLLTVANYNY